MHCRLTTFFTLVLLFVTTLAFGQERVSVSKAKWENKPEGNSRVSGMQQTDKPDGGNKEQEEGPDGKKKKDEKPPVEQLESFVFDKSIVKERMFTWQIDRYTNMPVMGRIDTLISDHLRDYIYRKDVGNTYLGVSGSAALPFDYFQRTQHDYMYALTPFNNYFVTPDNISFYNTRSPYTRFTYSGNPFANKNFEELNLEALHTQNLTAEWNAGVIYRRLGGNGLLTNEATDNRMFTLFTSYTGKRYAGQLGYIYNGTKNYQNGGVTDDRNILDTTYDVRTIAVNLQSAREEINTNTFFLTHSYGVPLNFLRKQAVRDTLRAGEGSVVYFGNTLELTNTKRIYTDEISLADSVGRKYYKNVFNIDPMQTRDSIHTTLFDGRLFLTLQPFSDDFIISKIGGGIGYRYLSNYSYHKGDSLSQTPNDTQNNLFLFANASGNFRRYFSWSAFTRYYFGGYNQNDLLFNAQAKLSLYPIRQGLHLWGKFSVDSRTPDRFLRYNYSNHMEWENNFNKTTETKIQAGLSIPAWQLNFSIGQSVLSSPVFFNTEARPEQRDETVSILSVSLEKNFQAWLMHFDNRALLQYSSHENIVPLPLFAINSAIYIELWVVNNVLRAQIGGDIYYNTKYHAYAYNPAAGAFHVQEEREVGNGLYIDGFLNLKWKQATVFFKVINAGQGWPNSDYFSAMHYIKPQRTIKFGISWPFYL